MAQIAIPRLPQAPPEYDPSQINQLINTIDLSNTSFKFFLHTGTTPN